MKSTIKKILNFIYRHTGIVYLITLAVAFTAVLVICISEARYKGDVFRTLEYSVIAGITIATLVAGFIYDRAHTLKIFGYSMLIAVIGCCCIAFCEFGPVVDRLFMLVPELMLFVYLPLRHFIRMPHINAEADFTQTIKNMCRKKT